MIYLTAWQGNQLAPPVLLVATAAAAVLQQGLEVQGNK
jgi:hypothetical protein